jgi:hypothetical protein
MVMAKSKNQQINTKLYKYWWVFALTVILVAFGSFFAYNKYLDQQNVNEMKELLAEFEKLKTSAEKETGEAYYIEATCGSASEKFSGKYSCRVTLPSKNIEGSSYYNKVESVLFLDKSCEELIGGQNGFKNAIRCDISVRNANKDDAEKIFLYYDTSPNSPF